MSVKTQIGRLEKALKDVSRCPSCERQARLVCVDSLEDPADDAPPCERCGAPRYAVITGVARLPGDPLPDGKS